jgi:serine protease
VLSLSMGYYHETPGDGLFDPIMYELLCDISNTGTVVVCSAGNDSTSRPSFPAAFAPWSTGTPPLPLDPDAPPIISVGARNPNGSSDALFTNAGPWVTCYTSGGAVMSTFPPFQGGLEPAARAVYRGRPRENIDPDDFRGGFGVWSGTSFSAPIIAGRVAKLIGARISEGDGQPMAVQRARDAVESIASQVDQ